MNKKFLSALLCGAFVTASTSTFVSCKDYDDDINSLDQKMNNEITAREALAQKVAAAENAIAELKSADAALQTQLKALEDKHAADVATLNSAIATKADANEVANLKKVADQNASDIASIKGQIATINDAIDALQKSLENYATKQNLADEVAGLNVNIDKALADAKAYTDAACALKADKAELDKTNSTLTQVQKDLADVISKYNTLSEDLVKTNDEVTKLKAALDAQKTALEKAIADGDAATLEAAKKAVADLKGEVEAADKKLQKAIDDVVADLNKKVDAEYVNAAIKTLQDDITATYATKADVKKDIDAVQASIKNIIEEKIPAVETKIANLDTKVEVISKILSNKLRSLVFMPSLYVDGIEAIQYRTLVDTVLTKTPVYGIERQRPGETYKKKITQLTDYIVPNTPKAIYYGPAWPVQYHLNPSTAGTKYADIKGFNVREAEVVTRAISANLGVTSPEFFEDGTTKIFDNSCGILTVGIKVAKPELLFANGPKAVKEGETGKISDGYDNIVALQAYSEKANAQDTTITSDYAMLQATKVYLEGLVWKSNVGKTRAAGLANKIQDPANLLALTNSDEFMYDETGYGKPQKKYNCGQHIHVWDTPDEALLDNTDNLVELYYNDRKGITLEDFLAVHYFEENAARTAHSKIKTWEFTGKYTNAWEDLKNYGISYSFEFVDYVIDGNGSKDSHYASLKAENGNIIAQNVKEDGQMYEDETATAVDREPLVRVLVKHGSDVLIDGYILVHITKTPPQDPEKNSITIPFDGAAKFDLCSGAEITMLNWSQFSKIILTDKLNNMEKVTFDANYGPSAAAYASTAIVGDPLGNKVYPTLAGVADGDWKNAQYVAGVGYKVKVNLYKDAKATAVAYKDTYGTVEYYHNESGTTNERLIWKFTADELEAITHDANFKAEGSEYTAYIRWSANNTGAPYEYIWLKLTAKITRDGVVKYTIGEKINNYWFDAETGAQDGYSAIVFNAVSPIDNGTTVNWNSKIRSTFKLNELFLLKENKADLVVVGTDANGSTRANSPLSISTIEGKANKSKVAKMAKYFFTPETTTITALNGKKYTITPQSGASDKDWNNMYSIYYLGSGSKYYPVADDAVHAWTSEAAANDVISKCAIAYAKGVFNNTSLYAVTGTTYTKIATLDPNNGEINLIHNDATYDVLNAIGYPDGGTDHKNINKELRAKVGVIAESGKCGIASQMQDATFLCSWQRPININDPEDQVVLDAKTNANYIYLADILHLYDWRGFELASGSDEDQKIRGCMEKPSTKWLWAYYNVKSITVDCTPSKVWTNMHGLNTTLDKVDPNYAYIRADEARNFTHTYSFDLHNLNGVNYNYASKSADLYKLFKEDEAVRKTIGYIYYDNNGDNVNEFDVIVPITVSYEWGTFTQKVKIHIKDTLGNADAKARK